ncbi:hypothetical protein EKI60_04660 [Candidatus Saccharibacteria bacterium]|nr:MAG: hypothetical protein EKI60_04660 [Candidatus Saccharibacteria bacterium]
MIYEPLSEAECYLFALTQDESGLDLAEFCLIDDTRPDGIFRAWPFQVSWWRNAENKTIDAGARSVGKSRSISLRAFAFPFIHPGNEMVITAPEAIHLQAVTDNIEILYTRNKLAREMLQGRIKHRPFHVNFANGARMMGRIPHHDGTGVKGIHPIWLEHDEAQDYGEAGWTEITSTVKDHPDSRWRCVAENQYVLTDNGWKYIQDIKVGDMVWTHKNRWKKVLNVFDNGIQDCVKTIGQGCDGLVTTPGHKFYVRNKKRRGPEFPDPQWLEVDKFTLDDKIESCWSSPIVVTEPSSPPAMEKKIPRNHTIDTSDHLWLWLYGLYLAEGYTVDFVHKGHRHSRAYWCLHDDEAPLVATMLQSLGFNTSYDKGPGKSTKVCVSNASVAEWLKINSGSLAINKRLAPWVFGMSQEHRQQVYNGLNFGDGSINQNRKRFEYSTVSPKLALDVKLLGQTLNHVCNISKKPGHDGVIDGRVIKCREGYVVQCTHIDDFKNPQTFKLEDRLFWSPITRIEDYGQVHVYDLEVEDDHSYCVEGIIVSNCHGVTRGVGDSFDDKITGQDSTWSVTRIPATYRPTWTEAQREQAIEEYGGYDSPDFRRNILGLPGDGNSPMFVLHRIMQCVDDDVFSDYNKFEYYSELIDEAMVREVDSIEDLIEIPATHRNYERVWVGMDLGWCVDTETEILTKRGWLKYDQVLIGDESLSIDPTTGRSSWETITDLYKDTGMYTMVHMKGQSFDAMTTPHHKWLVGGDAEGWSWKTTETLCSDDLIPLVSLKNWGPASEDELVEITSSRLDDLTENITIDHKFRTIWCPTIKHRNWLARRNGSIYFTGNTVAPTAITVFAEVNDGKKVKSSLKLVTKLLLRRVAPEDQVKVVMNLMEMYRPVAFTLDATGAGFPLIDNLKEKVKGHEDLAFMLDRIKPAGFSEKVIVGFDDNVKINELDPAGFMAAAIKRPYIEASTDAVRVLIDEKRMILPYDKSIIGELQSTPKNARSGVDHYGKTTRRKQGMHTLDAMRMACLSHQTHFVEEIIASHDQLWTPPDMIIF